MTHEGLRALRWVGRVLSLLAAWPLWYAFFGKLKFDWEAMMFGGPGMLVGLVLWTWAGYRLRHLPGTPAARTVGELLAARVDAVIDAGRGVGATLGLTAITGICAYASVRQLARIDGEDSEAGVALAVLFAVLVLGWRAVRGSAIAAGVALVAGVAFVSKPWLAPVTREFMGESYQLSPTAETHLYYVIPGLGLCVLGFVLLSSIELRKSANATPIRNEPIELEPPRPKPPQPPGG